MPIRAKTYVGTTNGGLEVMGILMSQFTVNDYQGVSSSMVYNNTAVNTLYFNIVLNPGQSCKSYLENGSSYFQATRLA